jgi:hypothetical protein
MWIRRNTDLHRFCSLAVKTTSVGRLDVGSILSNSLLFALFSFKPPPRLSPAFEELGQAQRALTPGISFVVLLRVWVVRVRVKVRRLGVRVGIY